MTCVFSYLCQPPSLLEALDRWGRGPIVHIVQFTYIFVQIHTIIVRTALHGTVKWVDLWWDRGEIGCSERMGERETCIDWGGKVTIMWDRHTGVVTNSMFPLSTENVCVYLCVCMSSLTLCKRIRIKITWLKTYGIQTEKVKTKLVPLDLRVEKFNKKRKNQGPQNRITAGSPRESGLNF